MVGGIIQTSRRSIFSLSKSLIPRIRQPFPPIIYAKNSFNTSAALQQKSPFETNLIRLLTNEIEFESDYAPPHQPDRKFNAFMVEDRPGEQFVTLMGRSNVGENIKIEATMFDGYGAIATNSRNEDAESNAEPHISLLIDISKDKKGDMLEFVCSAWPECLEIQKLYVFDGTLSQPYTGPDFRDLNKKLQSSLYEFLNARGVNDDLSLFLHRYVWNKDKAEHIQRLKLLKSYIER